MESRQDKYYLKAFENFTRWCFAPIPHWPTLLGGAITPLRMNRLMLERKPVYRAYTRKEFCGIIEKIYDRLASDTDNMENWSEFKRNLWDRMQSFKERKRIKTDDALKVQMSRLIDISWTDYQKTLRQMKNH